MYYVKRDETPVTKQAQTMSYAQKINICKSCPMRKSDNVCSLCGCDVISKAQNPDNKCPVGKW